MSAPKAALAFSPVTPALPERTRELFVQLAALGIPWVRILEEEIEAERALRQKFALLEDDWPLWAAFVSLPLSPLASFRVRDRIHALSCEARSLQCPSASRQLRGALRHLLGNVNGAPALAIERHLWFAYQRVLMLQRVGRAARQSRGPQEDRLAFVTMKTACDLTDAKWGLAWDERPSGGHLLDAAMRRAREEGYQIPFVGSEAKSFRLLRQAARSLSGPLRR
jgi:hypothetical protein